MSDEKKICAFEGCDKEATTFACGRTYHDESVVYHPTPAWYCDGHANVVANEGWPEYFNNCPACGCLHGVN